MHGGPSPGAPKGNKNALKHGWYALVLAPDVFLNMRTEQVAKLALRHAVPAIHQYPTFAAAGGLISFGADENEYYRLVGTYAGRILKGDKPGDLPV